MEKAITQNDGTIKTYNSTPKSWGNVIGGFDLLTDSQLESYGFYNIEDIKTTHSDFDSRIHNKGSLSFDSDNNIYIWSKENKISIDTQFVGVLRVLKVLIELTNKTLDTDIKSIKKAARKGISEELIKRVNTIISSVEIEIKNDNKIHWKNRPIDKIKKGKSYENAEVEEMAEDALNEKEKEKVDYVENKGL